VPRIAGRAQPTCAAYARFAGPKLAAYLDAVSGARTEALDRLTCLRRRGQLSARRNATTEIDDLDTPADYETSWPSLRA